MRSVMTAVVAATAAVLLTVASADAAKGKNAQGAASGWTDQQVLDAGYGGNPFVAGAYNEGPGGAPLYASECYDDAAAARAWADSVAGGAALVSERTTVRFFEFTYANGTVRAHRCSYYDAPNTYNGNRSNTGIIDFVEYAWYLDHAGDISVGVLDAVDVRSASEAGIDYYYVTIDISIATDGSSPAICDVAHVMKAQHRVNKNNGAVSVATEEVQTVPGYCNPFS